MKCVLNFITRRACLSILLMVLVNTNSYTERAVIILIVFMWYSRVPYITFFIIWSALLGEETQNTRALTFRGRHISIRLHSLNHSEALKTLSADDETSYCVFSNAVLFQSRLNVCLFSLLRFIYLFQAVLFMYPKISLADITSRFVWILKYLFLLMIVVWREIFTSDGWRTVSVFFQTWKVLILDQWSFVT